MRFFRSKSVANQCEIPFCPGSATRTVKMGNVVHHFCEKHFCQTNIPPETKRKIDNDWLTEDRKRRMFNPNLEEKTTIEFLVQRGILEGHSWGGRASYRPTEKFDNSVAEIQLDLMLNHGYLGSMLTSMKEAAKIAISQSIADAKTQDVENYAEIVCPFMLFSRMDKEIHGGRINQELPKKAPDQWLREKDKQRTIEIKQEIARGGFEKAMKLTLAYIEENKDKDPFTEAHYNDLVSSVLVHKFELELKRADPSDVNRGLLPMIEYAVARKHLDRCLLLYQSLEQTPKNQLLVANTKVKIAGFASMAARPDDGLELCLESFLMFKKHKHEQGMRNAADTWYNLRTLKLTIEMTNIMLDDTLEFKTKCERLEIVRDRMRMLKEEIHPSSEE